MIFLFSATSPKVTPGMAAAAQAASGHGATLAFGLGLGFCLTLAVLYGLVWLRHRTDRTSLYFALGAAFTAAMVVCELGMMHAGSPEAYGAILRWFHVLGLGMVASFTVFAYFRLGTGRPLLAGLAIGMRAAAVLGPNLFGAANLNYLRMTGLPQVACLGERVAIPAGVINPWTFLGHASLVAMLAFIVDASVTAWRRGNRRGAVRVGGGLILWNVLGAVLSIATVWGLVAAPLVGSPFALGLLATMGIELSSEQRRLEQELEDRRREVARLGRVSAMGMLSAAIAHELNQPLAAILYNAEAGLHMVEGARPDLGELRALLRDIADQDLRADEAVRGLRALFQGEAPHGEVLQPGPVLAAAAALVRQRAARRRTALDLDLAEPLPSVQGDRVQLQLVLVNLLVNALEALESRPAGTGLVTVRAGRTGDGGLRMQVQDNGPGLPAHLGERIFDPFVSTKPAGMGLGLSICQSIVQGMGGRLQAAGGPGGGAVFAVTLPACAPAQEAP